MLHLDKRICFLAACLLVVGTGGGRAEGVRSTVAAGVGTLRASTNLHNLYQAATNVFSGSAPEDAAAFQELRGLGIGTVISVDGRKPDVAAARRAGLRYIHLPFGYDGIPSRRVSELAKAVQSAVGPVYVHCHHGLHRGPAAVAVICEATAGWTTNDAVAWLQQAGTALDYAGLYRAAAGFRAPAPTELARVGDLPEVAPTSSLVDTMIEVDKEFDRLKAAQKAGWSKVPGQPDLVAAHTATILWEHFRELARTDDTAGRPDDFRAKLAGAETAAARLREILRETGTETGTGLEARDAAFRVLSQGCVDCHRRHRD